MTAPSPRHVRAAHARAALARERERAVPMPWVSRCCKAFEWHAICATTVHPFKGCACWCGHGVGVEEVAVESAPRVAAFVAGGGR